MEGLNNIFKNYILKRVVRFGSLLALLMGPSSTFANIFNCREHLLALKYQWAAVIRSLGPNEVAILDFGGERYAVATSETETSSQAEGLFKDRIRFSDRYFPRDSFWRFYPTLTYRIYDEPKVVDELNLLAEVDASLRRIRRKHEFPFGYGTIGSYSEPIRSGTLVAWPRLTKVLVLSALIAAPLLIKTPVGFKNFYSSTGNLITHLEADRLEGVLAAEIKPIRHLIYQTDYRFESYQSDRELQRLNWTNDVRSSPENFEHHLRRARLIRERLKELDPAFVIGIMRAHLTDDQLRIAAGLDQGEFDGISGEVLKILFPWMSDRLKLSSLAFEEIFLLLRSYHSEADEVFAEIMKSPRKEGAR